MPMFQMWVSGFIVGLAFLCGLQKRWIRMTVYLLVGLLQAWLALNG